jgi:hypothetical protein
MLELFDAYGYRDTVVTSKFVPVSSMDSGITQESIITSTINRQYYLDRFYFSFEQMLTQL